MVSTYYLSRIIGSNVYSTSGKSIGKIKDLIVEIDFIRPKVVAVSLKSDEGIQIIDYVPFQIKKDKDKGKYLINCSKLIEYKLDSKKTFYLSKNVLDRQIVDMHGRKLVRVNDIRLASLATGTFLIAVDVGVEGLLRRLGIAKLLKKILKPFKINLPNHYIIWDEVETVDFGHEGIKLSKGTSNLSKLHPSDLADIIEEMDRNTQFAVFASLDDERAADVLEELELEAQISVIENLSIEKAADLLEKMPADEAADLLDQLKKEKAEELLNEMEEEASGEIRDLMEYPDSQVGSIMTTDYICFKETTTIGDTINELRKLKPEGDTIYYIYVVNNHDKLIATVSLRDIIVTQPDITLKEIMNKNIVYVYDTDKIESLNEIISKYNLLAVPVVNEYNVLLGMVIINDLVYILLKGKRKRV